MEGYDLQAVQYLITAFDGHDAEAAERRLSSRPAHIALGDELVARGEKLYGCAILDDRGAMTGSAAFMEFSDRDALDAYLECEPYVTGGVWESITIRPCSRRPTPLPPFRPSDVGMEQRTQTLVIGLDGSDAGAMERRLAARPAHIALGDEMVARSEMLYGAAILNDAGEMVGSALIMDFESQDQLDAWLAREPYVAGKVWETVEVRPCRVGPSQWRLHPAVDA
jgi:uncharacterized protein YciI